MLVYYTTPDDRDPAFLFTADEYPIVPRPGERVALPDGRQLTAHQIVHFPWGSEEHGFPHATVTLRGTTSG